MTALHDPLSGFDSGLALARPGGCAPYAHVGGEAKHGQCGPPVFIVIPLIQTQALGLFLPRLGPLHDQALERRRDQAQIRPIGPGHHDAQWHAVAFGQQAAFAPALAPLGRIGAGFFPRPAELWSWPHPYLATASRCPATRQTALRPLARVSKRRLRRPTAGSDHEPWSGGKGRWRPRQPTDSRYATRRRWHRHTADRACAAYPRQTAGCSGAWGASTAAGSTAHPRH